MPSLTSIFTRLFAKSASFYNPLIYFGLSAKFRKDVGVLLPCARESKDTVKLKRFKNLKGKQEGGGGHQQHRRRDQGERAERGDARTPMPPPPNQKMGPGSEPPYPSPSPDSGVGSTPRTPPQVIEDPPVFVIDFPHSESPGYEIDRL